MGVSPLCLLHLSEIACLVKACSLFVFVWVWHSACVWNHIVQSLSYTVRGCGSGGKVGRGKTGVAYPIHLHTFFVVDVSFTRLWVGADHVCFAKWFLEKLVRPLLLCSFFQKVSVS